LEIPQILFTRGVDNDIMSNKNQRSIRFEPWVREAIEELASEHKIDFSKEVENLLIVELSYKGYTEAAWLAKTYGIGREARGGSETEPAGKQSVG
jgi:hypothetical protein